MNNTESIRNPDYLRVTIQISNQAEKLATLLYLSLVSGYPVAPLVLQNTLDNVSIIEYPFVYIGGGNVTASCQDNGKVVFPFAKINELATYKYTPPPQVVLNGKHTAVVQSNGDVQVGCQTFPGKTILELAELVKKFIKS